MFLDSSYSALWGYWELNFGIGSRTFDNQAVEKIIARATVIEFAGPSQPSRFRLAANRHAESNLLRLPAVT